MDTIQTLKGKHLKQPAWIVGKGPSLRYIKKEHFGEGIVITLNESIVDIESLNLPNPLYSLQKDGGSGRHHTFDNLSPNCDFTPNCGGHCGTMIRPRYATLLLHDLESKYCFANYPNRVVFDLKTLGLDANIHSAVFVTMIALYMGCTKLNYLCFDASTTGDNRAYVHGKEPIGGVVYGYQRGYIETLIEGVENNWLTPQENGDLL